ncbi:uncharacterized protein LOC128985040 [Macrosteles quadrilineatus]|uniref:uncharacterized protein LOC128985040 n=1 Tax=Macrosteles quadrilineatus TaxID=74068 RepID=UPI0023E2D23C|nr:uncharacterized protein LOC128985040 [Macrosteles quadrilineatus]
MENGGKHPESPRRGLGGSPGTSGTPESPRTPGGTRRLRDFYEQLWSGSKTGSPVHETKATAVDVTEMEKRLEEEKRKRMTESADLRERVTLRHAGATPRRDVKVSRWGSGASSSSSAHDSFEEVVEHTVEEGDLAEVDGKLTGGKVVQFERVTVHKTVREFVPSKISVSRTPSEEQLTREDSAYLSQKSLGSRTSSVTSLASVKSEDLLEEQHQWYQDYQHTIHPGVVRREVRSRTQYDTHIQQIRDIQTHRQTDRRRMFSQRGPNSRQVGQIPCGNLESLDNNEQPRPAFAPDCGRDCARSGVSVGVKCPGLYTQSPPSSLSTRYTPRDHGLAPEEVREKR